MPRGPESFFDAVRRAKREHRLTDLLALVLEAHAGFANKLLAAAGLPEAAQVRTRIEVLTRRGRPVDLELLAYDERGAVIGRLWSENKTGARYQPEQLPDYAKDLPLQPSARQLITIVNTLSEVPWMSAALTLPGGALSPGETSRSWPGRPAARRPTPLSDRPGSRQLSDHRHSPPSACCLN